MSIRPSARAVERRAHAAAAVVAAHDDVLHPQHVDGVLEHGEAVEVGVDDDVGDVAVHEHLARRRPTIWFAGTRLSEQPIQRYSGALAVGQIAKNSGSSAVIAAAQARLRSNNSVRSATPRDAIERLTRDLTAISECGENGVR